MPKINISHSVAKLPVAAIACTLIGLFSTSAGFFGITTNLAGVVISLTAIVAAIVAHIKHCETRISLTTVLFFVTAILFLGSGATHAMSTTSLSETGCWFAVAAISFLVGTLSTREKSLLVTIIAWLGFATSAIGIVVFFASLDTGNFVADSRLQMTTGYANTLAVWFGCTGLCLYHSYSDWRRFLSAVNAVGLVVTGSGGGIVCTAIVTIILIIAKLRQSDPSRKTVIVAGIIAAALVAIAAAISFTFFNERASSAWMHLIERLTYMKDALLILVSSPLLGIGPDNWQFVYQYHQTSQYTVSVVHCSYLQIGLDAGILALAAFIAAIVLGCLAQLKGIKSSDWSSRLLYLCGPSALLLILHAVIDFDFQFGLIALLLAILVTPPNDAKELAAESVRLKLLKHRAVGYVMLALCLGMTLTGLGSASSLQSMQTATRNGNYARAAQTFYNDPFIQNDHKGRESFLATLCSSGNTDIAADYAASLQLPSDGETVVAAECLYASGQQIEAEELLLSAMEQKSYDVFLARQTIQKFQEYPPTKTHSSKLDALVAGMNNKAAEQTEAGIPEQQTINRD